MGSEVEAGQRRNSSVSCAGGSEARGQVDTCPSQFQWEGKREAVMVGRLEVGAGILLLLKVERELRLLTEREKWSPTEAGKLGEKRGSGTAALG